MMRDMRDMKDMFAIIACSCTLDVSWRLLHSYDDILLFCFYFPSPLSCSLLRPSFATIFCNDLLQRSFCCCIAANRYTNIDYIYLSLLSIYPLSNPLWNPLWNIYPIKQESKQVIQREIMSDHRPLQVSQGIQECNFNTIVCLQYKSVSSTQK